MSYSPNQVDLYHRAADYVYRILKVPSPPIYLSFPKIISGRIRDVARPISERRQWCPIVGLPDEKAHLSAMPGADALDLIRRIGGKYSPQVRLAEDHHLIQALAPQGADQTFRKAILPWRCGEIGRSRIPFAPTRDVKTCP